MCPFCLAGEQLYELNGPGGAAPATELYDLGHKDSGRAGSKGPSAYDLEAPQDPSAYDLGAAQDSSAYDLGAAQDSSAYDLGAAQDSNAYDLGAAQDPNAYDLEASGQQGQGGAPLYDADFGLPGAGGGGGGPSHYDADFGVGGKVGASPLPAAPPNMRRKFGFHVPEGLWAQLRVFRKRAFWPQ